MVEKVARSISCLALMEEIMNIIYEKWDEILETVKTEHELSDVSFKTWLKPLTIHSIDDQVVPYWFLLSRLDLTISAKNTPSH